MSTETSDWIGLLHWAISNPEKGALTLVLVMGAWKWVRELRKDWKEDQHQETFTETLLRENKDLRAENKDLVHELREARSQRNLNGEKK
jgi:Sec-independent protein translocase protein TatA